MQQVHIEKNEFGNKTTSYAPELLGEQSPEFLASLLRVCIRKVWFLVSYLVRKHNSKIAGKGSMQERYKLLQSKCTMLFVECIMPIVHGVVDYRTLNMVHT